MTAQDLSEKWEIPLSTVYRKLRLLQDAGLVEESTEIRMDGKHTSRYRLNFEEVVIRLTKDEFQTHISQGDKPKFTDRLRQ